MLTKVLFSELTSVSRVGTLAGTKRMACVGFSVFIQKSPRNNRMFTYVHMYVYTSYLNKYIFIYLDIYIYRCTIVPMVRELNLENVLTCFTF